MDNTQQFEFWNGPVGERWASRQERMDHHLQAIQDALMAFAAPAPGMSVLDVGCGGGTTSLALAKAVAPGRVTGLDISAPMIASACLRAEGMPEVEFVHADASAHPYAPDYDLVFSRFGVMFFADPAEGFAHLKKALKPGGRLAFACWRSFEENEWFIRTYDAARDLVPAEPETDPHAPGPFALADRARLMSLLSRAGFKDVRVEALDSVTNMGSTAEDAAYEAMQFGPLARAARDLDDDTRREIRSRLIAVFNDYHTPAGITPPAACWLVSATA